MSPLAERSDRLLSVFQRRAATAGGAWRRSRQFCLAGRASSQSRMLVTLRSVSKGRNHGFANRDKSRARPFDTGALTTDASTFEEQRQGIGEQIGLRNPGIPAELRQTAGMRGLESLDDASPRMIAPSHPNRRIAHVAPAAIADGALGPAT